MRFISLFSLLFLFKIAQAQHNFVCVVEEALTKERLHGVTAAIACSTRATSSDSSGRIFLAILPQAI